TAPLVPHAVSAAPPMRHKLCQRYWLRCLGVNINAIRGTDILRCNPRRFVSSQQLTSLDPIINIISTRTHTLQEPPNKFNDTIVLDPVAKNSPSRFDPLTHTSCIIANDLT